MNTPTQDRWERLAAAGGRLLAEYAGCEASGHYALEIFRFDHPSGGRAHLCQSHWSDAWLAAGRPPQPLLGEAREAPSNDLQTAPEGSV